MTSNTSYRPGDRVLIEYAGDEPAAAEIVDPQPDPTRNVAKVKYLHSRTVAYVAHNRILGTPDA